MNQDRNELISAYLDGELSAQETADVERLLAESAESRQLLEELRALSSGLKDLPRLELTPDFKNQVLRRAERRMLTDSWHLAPADGPAIAGAVGSAASASATSPGSDPNADHASRKHDPRSGQRDDHSQRDVLPWPKRIVRPLTWAALTIAAAIVIMVANRPHQNEGDGRRVAQVEPDEPPQPGNETAAAGRGSAAGERLAKNSHPDMRAAERKFSDGETAGPTDTAVLRHERLDELKSVNELGVPQAESVTADGLRQAGDAGESNVPERLNRSGKFAQRRRMENSSELKLEAVETPESAAAPAASMLADQSASDALSTESAPLLVVQVDITPEAAARGDLISFFGNQNIAFEAPAGPPVAAARALSRDTEADLDAPAAPEPADSAAKKGDTETAEQPATDALSITVSEPSVAAFSAEANAGEVTDVYYVQASLEQIQAALNDISSRPDLFQSVAVTPAPGVEAQQPLATFSRQLQPGVATGAVTVFGGAGSASPGVSMDIRTQPRALRMQVTAPQALKAQADISVSVSPEIAKEAEAPAPPADAAVTDQPTDEAGKAGLDDAGDDRQRSESRSYVRRLDMPADEALEAAKSQEKDRLLRSDSAKPAEKKSRTRRAGDEKQKADKSPSKQEKAAPDRGLAEEELRDIPQADRVRALFLVRVIPATPAAAPAEEPAPAPASEPDSPSSETPTPESPGSEPPASETPSNDEASPEATDEQPPAEGAASEASE